MDKMKNMTECNAIYDLSNDHFRNIELTTKHGDSLKGQFVKFEVKEDVLGYRVYPSEKFCFLPEENSNEFWSTYKKNNGVFDELPAYIRELGLDEIVKISIAPLLIV